MAELLKSPTVGALMKHEVQIQLNNIIRFHLF